MLVVTYHALGEVASRVVTPARRLHDDLSALSDAGFAFVSLDACADWLGGRVVLPPRSAVVTFDDGYASVVSEGLPVLERLHVPATVFVVAGRVGLDNQWPGQPSWVPPMPLVDQRRLRDLVAAGVAIGSHSSSHPRLPALDDRTLHEEVVAAADRLAEMAGVEVRHFAYPYGLYGAREMAAAQPRFRTAVTAECRSALAGSDPHALGRIDAHDLHVAARLNLLESAAMTPYLGVRRALRRLRR